MSSIGNSNGEVRLRTVSWLVCALALTAELLKRFVLLLACSLVFLVALAFELVLVPLLGSRH